MECDVEHDGCRARRCDHGWPEHCRDCCERRHAYVGARANSRAWTSDSNSHTDGCRHGNIKRDVYVNCVCEVDVNFDNESLGVVVSDCCSYFYGIANVIKHCNVDVVKHC